MKKRSLIVLETNIDDMNPQWYPPLIDNLLKAGALDATLTPVIMKKGRPGIIVKVLAAKKSQKKLLDILFTETTTIGVRTYPVTRYELPREIKKVKTPRGMIRVKIVRKGKKILRSTPEFEDIK